MKTFTEFQMLLIQIEREYIVKQGCIKLEDE